MGAPGTIELDRTREDADGIKTSWPYASVGDALYSILGVGSAVEQAQNCRDFMGYPVFRYAPKDVRQALRKRGFDVPFA